jgi:phosphate transport system substrate-binding protein
MRSRACGSTLVLLAALALARGGSTASAEQFDLSALPAYTPGPRVHGVIRIHGNNGDLALVNRWEKEFVDAHRDIRYRTYLLTTPVTFSGLCAGTADMGLMGHSWWRSDLKAFNAFFGYDPLEIKFATGSYNTQRGSTPGPVFLVHKDNPLRGLTLKQIDGIFGAQRTGGWERTKWSARAARGPEENIRTWGRLGLTGEWADKPIDLYGFDATLSNWSDLIQKVAFRGGTKWNPALTEIVRGGVEKPADERVVEAVANDRHGLAFCFQRVIDRVKVEVKVLPVAASEGAPLVPPSAQTFFDGTYPMNNAVYIYLNRPPGQPLPPQVKEFLRYILSRQGQTALAEDGTYIPLSAEMVQAELRKLE